MLRPPITRGLTALLAGILLVSAPTAAGETIPLTNWAAVPFWTPPAESHVSGPAEARGARQALAASPVPLPFIALPPCRLVDTRSPVFPAPLGGGFLPPATVRSYTLSGVCGVPVSARAISLNVTVVHPTGPGFITLWPEGGAFPPVSTLNYLGNDVVVNAAVVPLSAAGGISIALGVSGGDVVLDTNGYYAPLSTVTSLNALAGDVALSPGSNVTIVPAGNTLTIAAGPLVSSLKGLTGSVDVAGTNGLSASAGSGTVTVTSNATPTNVPGAIVSRDGTGSFGAGGVTLSGDLTLPVSSPSAGRLIQNATPLLHAFGADNVFLGANAGNSTMTGGQNTASGAEVLHNDTSGGFNTGVGFQALLHNTTGSANTANGAWALLDNTTGDFNTAVGYQALSANTVATQSVAIGPQALFSNSSGDANTASGYQSLRSNLTGANNTANGAAALFSNTTGHRNVAVGFGAGSNLTTGSDNIAVGHEGVAGESATTRIGTSGAQTRAFVAGIRGVTTGNADAIPVLVDSSGQLGTVSSSARTKRDIADMGEASARLMQLRPVTFRYREHGPDAPAQFGLVAEEVDEVMPDLVARNRDGEVETVLYHALPAMLLNELQKAVRRIERLEREIAALAAAR